MNLKLKEGVFLKDSNGYKHYDCIMEAYDLHIDRERRKTVRVGVYNDIESVHLDPLEIITWTFTLEPQSPTFDIHGNMVTTGHIGSANICQVMDILKPTDNPNIIAPNTVESQLWILAQPFKEGVIGDYFEFTDGLIVKEEVIIIEESDEDDD